jgi:putative transcriptional regulator
VSGRGAVRIAAQSRPIDTLLAAYAAGSLSEPLHLLVTAHLQMKPESRAYVAALEAAGGALIDTIELAPLPERDRRLAEIFASAEPATQQVPPAPAPAMIATNVRLPPALRARYGKDLAACRWRTLLPGLRQCVLAKDANGEVSFLRCRAGGKLPAHTHDGFEAALVLAGGYSDATGQYRPGDIALADETIDHRPIVDQDGECLVFLVLEGSVRLTGAFGRILQRILG